jgi:hypothetical protein
VSRALLALLLLCAAACRTPVVVSAEEAARLSDSDWTIRAEPRSEPQDEPELAPRPETDR